MKHAQWFEGSNRNHKPKGDNDMEQITLYCRAGSSDKVYQAAIQPEADNQYSVQYAYGRRGATLQTGTKTSVPVEYHMARSIYDGLVKEKTAKGYTPGESGTPYQNTAHEPLTTGVGSA
ncbi:MAG TPA: WGR domain-containing protein [Chthoniobacteraceae bacterium]|jgi:bifunctional non-homologous end joining protein LigD|nr:WGR domain-containing protein [Chthoniobacteraceae bacterium]